MKRRVIVVDGPLAFRMRRLEAARACALGLEILTLPLLAARLAGGFCSLVNRELLAAAIAAALDSGDFEDIEDVRNLPGMVRAVMQTLDRVWAADLDLDALAKTSPRLSDLALIQRRVRGALPVGAMLPQDLRDTALSRIQFAPSVFGSVSLDGLVNVDPVWRSLLIALTSQIGLSWTAIGVADRSWFPGIVTVSEKKTPQEIEGDLCADPRAEVVEALRWARELLCRGDIAAAEIAIAAASPATWDEHMLVLSQDGGLPVHFSHGLPALSTWGGQDCAALADILVNGLSQDRVRRLLGRSPSPTSVSLPSDWAAGLPRRAGLFTVEQWRQALVAARARRQEPETAERVLLPILELLAHGTSRANEAGPLLLSAAGLGLWKEALRSAPAAAIFLSLRALRVRDERDPGNSMVWGPASHLISSPRRWVRLLGLDGRAWPRPEGEDALVPNHVLARRCLVAVSITDSDRAAFDLLLGRTLQGVVISRSKRSADGALQCASALWPAGVVARPRTKDRTPEHAFSEADRLLARPSEAGNPLASRRREFVGGIGIVPRSRLTTARFRPVIRQLSARWHEFTRQHRSSGSHGIHSALCGDMRSACDRSRWRSSPSPLTRCCSASSFMNCSDEPSMRSNPIRGLSELRATRLRPRCRPRVIMSARNGHSSDRFPQRCYGHIRSTKRHDAA